MGQIGPFPGASDFFNGLLARISHQVPSTTAVSAAVDCVHAQDSILNVLLARLRSNPSALLATATLTTPRYETW